MLFRSGWPVSLPQNAAAGFGTLLVCPKKDLEGFLIPGVLAGSVIASFPASTLGSPNTSLFLSELSILGRQTQVTILLDPRIGLYTEQIPKNLPVLSLMTCWHLGQTPRETGMLHAPDKEVVC